MFISVSVYSLTPEVGVIPLLDSLLAETMGNPEKAAVEMPALSLWSLNSVFDSFLTSNHLRDVLYTVLLYTCEHM